MKKIIVKKEEVHLPYLMLINPDHPLTEEKITLKAVDESGFVLMEEEAQEQLKKALQAWGFKDKVTAVSGYRSKADQLEIWNDCMQKKGEEYTRSFVAIPGCSEHQSGLAIDLAKKKENIDFICPDLPYDKEFESLRRVLTEYGFIERYPAGKEAITHISKEPWHFRYVGLPHSLIMKKRNLVLEEYHSLLQCTSKDKPIFYSTKDKFYAVWRISLEEESLITIADEDKICITKDNCKGAVITVWTER